MRRQVEEIQCTRCERVEYVDASGRTAPVVAFAAKLHDDEDEKVVEVKFTDLCGPCLRSVRALLLQIGKKIEGVSPDRARDPVKKAEDKPAASKKDAAHNGAASVSHATAAAKTGGATPGRSSP